MYQEADSFQFLDPIRTLEVLADLFHDHLVAFQASCVPKSGRVDDGQRVVQVGSLHPEDVVSGHVLRLTDGLRLGRFFDQLEAEVVLPSDSQDVVEHSVDQSALTGSSGTNYKDGLADELVDSAAELAVADEFFLAQNRFLDGEMHNFDSVLILDALIVECTGVVADDASNPFGFFVGTQRNGLTGHSGAQDSAIGRHLDHVSLFTVQIFDVVLPLAGGQLTEERWIVFRPVVNDVTADGDASIQRRISPRDAQTGLSCVPQLDGGGRIANGSNYFRTHFRAELAAAEQVNSGHAEVVSRFLLERLKLEESVADSGHPIPVKLSLFTVFHQEVLQVLPAGDIPLQTDLGLVILDYTQVGGWLRKLDPIRHQVALHVKLQLGAR